MEVLRDLIFGNQARDFTQRLSDIDDRLEAIRRELKSEQDLFTQSLTKSSVDQGTTLRKETHGRIDKEVQMLSERIEQLTADMSRQFEEARRMFEAKLDRLQTESGDRIRQLEEKTRQRDDDLRSEMLAASAWLEDKKTSRHDLGRMLEELGRQIQGNIEAAASEPGDEA
ncbi:MAG: hypothetical protein KBF17_09175 [Candidatus Promineofilum sp.]|nr:hypothetical protein [Promineifilum sp.]MBP9657692.1 hypothetical protein [Promineifilum sp.]